MRWECRTASCPAHSETPSVRLQRLSQTSSCQHASFDACKQAQPEPEVVNSKQNTIQHMYIVYAYTIMHNHFRGLKTRPCMSAQCILQVADSLWYICQLADRVAQPCAVWETTRYQGWPPCNTQPFVCSIKLTIVDTS